MKEVILLKSHVLELLNSNFLFYTTPKDEMVEIKDQDTIDAAAKIWKVSSIVVEEINSGFNFMKEQFVEAIHSDLEDMWDEIHK